MKFIALFSLILTIQPSFAQEKAPETDFRKCQQFLGFEPVLNEKGEFDNDGGVAFPAPVINSVKDGDMTRITYTYNFPGKKDGKPDVRIVTLEKDKDNNLTSIIVGPEKVSDEDMKAYKDKWLYEAVHSGIPMGAFTVDPSITVKSETQGVVSIPLSKLTKEEAESAGIDWDDVKKVRSGSRKDKRALKKLYKEYARFVDKAPQVHRNGVQADVEVKDKSCTLSRVSARYYDPKMKFNFPSNHLTKERCEEVNKAHLKFNKQLHACSNTQLGLYKELNKTEVPDPAKAGINPYDPGVLGMSSNATAGVNLVSEMSLCENYFGPRPDVGWVPTQLKPTAPAKTGSGVIGN